MAWIRLDTDFFTNDEICEMTFPARYAVLGTLAYIKAHGNKGKTKATAKQIARSSDFSLTSVEEALECSMFICSGKTIQVVNWQGFQIDPTATERKAAQREREKDVTAVTVTTESHGCHDYRTGQDVTGQDRGEEEKPPSLTKTWNPQNPGDNGDEALIGLMDEWAARMNVDRLNINAKELGYIERYLGLKGLDWCRNVIRSTKESWIGRAFIAAENDDERQQSIKPKGEKAVAATCETPGCTGHGSVKRNPATGKYECVRCRKG